MLGVDADEDTLRRMVERYEELLPTSLPRKQGRVLPNVREILEHLRGRADVRSYLLTGNTRGGARAKLTHYDLMHYFPDGAFAEDAGDRADDRRARAGAGAAARARSPRTSVFVIGDTPHDIECANAIGARTIAVATGGYTLEELQAHRPVACVRRAARPPTQFVDDSSTMSGRRRRMKHGIRTVPARCGVRRGWRGAGTTRGSAPIRTGGRSWPPTPRCGSRRERRRRAARAC